MRSTVWGYETATLERALASGALDVLARELTAFAAATKGSPQLAGALTDPSIADAVRRGVVADLVQAKARAETVRLLVYTVAQEHPSEIVEALAECADRAERIAADPEKLRGTSGLSTPEPAASRQVARLRLAGYCAEICDATEGPTELDALEDDLFRFARIVEASPSLRHALVDVNATVEMRQGIVLDLLGSRAGRSTLRLVAYILAAGRMRDIVGTLDQLVIQVAAMRGRRVAEVRTAYPLAPGQIAELSRRLTAPGGAPVEVRVALDPSLIGGMRVAIGTTLVDGTVRHLLDELAESMRQTGAVGA